MMFINYIAITSVLFFVETKGEELLLSALKKDIEENVMERVIKYFSKYDEKIQQINNVLTDITDKLSKISADIIVLQEKDVEFQDKITFLVETNRTTQNQIIQQRMHKLEEITKTLALRSCYEYMEYGIKTPGMYYIDPDGRLGVGAPFPVNCDFESGITEVIHDQQEKIEIPHCSGNMCYELDLRYPTTKQQLSSLIDLSDSCTQQIQFDCYMAPLFRSGEPVGAWTNREGENEYYFSGSYHGYHLCECGRNRNCSNPSVHYCNCDLRKAEYQTDIGLITNMSALPITGFKYGRLQIPSQSAFISIGNLKCSGRKELQLKMVSSSCQNMKRHGMIHSGNYIMNDGSVVFCDMAKHILDPQIQNHVGKLLFKDVMFEAIIEGNHHSYLPAGVITFDRLVFQFKANFNITSGIFTADRNGVYYFQIDGFIYFITVRARLLVYFNNIPIRDIWNDGAEEYQNGRQLTSFWTFEMKEGDQVYLSNSYEHSFLVDGNQPFVFMGHIIPS